MTVQLSMPTEGGAVRELPPGIRCRAQANDTITNVGSAPVRVNFIAQDLTVRPATLGAGQSQVITAACSVVVLS